MYEKLQALLDEKGITAYKLASDTGMSRSTLSDWKNGKSIPKADKLYVIAQYFGVTIEYFLEE